MIRKPSWNWHPAVRKLGLSERAIESIASLLGSPAYLLIQTVVVVVWVAANLLALSLRWDPYPFILLNLALGMASAYAAPIILFAQNRADEVREQRAKFDHEMLCRLTTEHERTRIQLGNMMAVLELLAGERGISVEDITARCQPLPEIPQMSLSPAPSGPAACSDERS